MRGDGRGEGDERIEFEEQRNRITLEIAQVGDENEKQKQAEEKYLRHAADVAKYEQIFWVELHACTSL